ncbi:hypothetical protein DCAR_0101557 [Daucus carota subsp. sativus]|uniref:Uncharacterized protein n=1 Tax=Daucus carota subsp. sativus TaxID=79200 RepID=A0A166GGG3_DAUCS|nr:hypothetical protein DCAR_0101557 [Daucus carota subsp. sativus]
MHVSYDERNCRLEGLGDFFTVFGLVGGEVLLFEYVDGKDFIVYIFGEDGNEIDYPAIVNASETSSSVTDSKKHGSWKFVKFISNAHVTDDEITVSVDFSRLTNQWKNKDKISVYKGHLSWVLEIKKRRRENRTTIHDGWIDLRDSLHLTIGDKCYFRWINESYHQFRVEIVKGDVFNIRE